MLRSEYKLSFKNRININWIIFLQMGESEGE